MAESRDKVIHVKFKVDMAEAKSEWDAQVREFEQRGVNITPHIVQPQSAGNVATFGQPGQPAPSGVSTYAASRLDQSNTARVAGAAMPVAAAMTTRSGAVDSPLHTPEQIERLRRKGSFESFSALAAEYGLEHQRGMSRQSTANQILDQMSSRRAQSAVASSFSQGSQTFIPAAQGVASFSALAAASVLEQRTQAPPESIARRTRTPEEQIERNLSAQEWREVRSRQRPSTIAKAAVASAITNEPMTPGQRDVEQNLAAQMLSGKNMGLSRTEANRLVAYTLSQRPELQTVEQIVPEALGIHGKGGVPAGWQKPAIGAANVASRTAGVGTTVSIDEARVRAAAESITGAGVKTARTLSDAVASVGRTVATFIGGGSGRNRPPLIAGGSADQPEPGGLGEAMDRPQTRIDKLRTRIRYLQDRYNQVKGTQLESAVHTELLQARAAEENMLTGGTGASSVESMPILRLLPRIVRPGAARILGTAPLTLGGTIAAGAVVAGVAAMMEVGKFQKQILDMNNQEFGGRIAAGGNVVMQRQVDLARVRREAEIRTALADSPLLSAPTLGLSGIVYRATMGQEDAQREALMQRQVVTAQMQREFRQQQRMAEYQRPTIGLEGAGLALAQLGERRSQMALEYERTRVENPEALPQLFARQNAERQNLNKQRESILRDFYGETRLLSAQTRATVMTSNRQFFAADIQAIDAKGEFDLERFNRKVAPGLPEEFANDRRREMRADVAARKAARIAQSEFESRAMGFEAGVSMTATTQRAGRAEFLANETEIRGSAQLARMSLDKSDPYYQRRMNAINSNELSQRINLRTGDIRAADLFEIGSRTEGIVAEQAARGHVFNAQRAQIEGAFQATVRQLDVSSPNYAKTLSNARNLRDSQTAALNIQIARQGLANDVGSIDRFGASMASAQNLGFSASMQMIEANQRQRILQLDRSSPRYQSDVANIGRDTAGQKLELTSRTYRAASIESQRERSTLMANQLQTQGFFLQAAKEDIGGRLIEDFRKIDFSAPGAIQKALNLESRGRQETSLAELNERRRVFEMGGSAKAAGFALFNRPLEAELQTVRTRYESQRMGMTSWVERARSMGMELLESAQVRQQFLQQRKMVDISQKYESQSIERRLAMDPIGAQAAEIVGSAVAEGNRLAFAGLQPEAEKARQIGLQQLKLTKQQYVLGFKAQEMDLRSVFPFNPRDVTSPGEVFKTIGEREEELKSKSFGMPGKGLAEEIGKHLEPIKNMLSPLMGLIERLASGSQ